MRRIFTVALVVVCSLFCANCELDTGENFFFVNMEITGADVPEVFILNQSHNMDVTFTRGDNCTFFQGFDVFTDENGTTTIVAIGSVLTEEDCSASEESLSGILTITAQDVSFYTLRFYNGEDAEGNAQYLKYTVPVVDGIN